MLRTFLLGLFGLACVAGDAAAQGLDPGLVSNPDSALVQALRAIEGEPVTLPAALAAALREAPQVRAARATLDAAAAVVRREKGAFDPEIFASLTREGRDVPAASPFAGADVLEEEETFTRAGGRLRLRPGTEIEVSLETTRLESNSIFAPLDPEYGATGRIDVRQPLLEGFGPAARAPLSRAEETLEAAGAEYDAARLALRSEIESIYWEIFASERDLAVARLIVEQAEAFVERARVRVEAGLSGTNEIASAQVFLAEQRLAAIDVEERLDALSDELASRIGRRPDGLRFRAAGSPPEAFPVVPEAELIETARARNREILAAERVQDAARASARGARWDALPRVDLVGSFGGNGLAGDVREDTSRVAFEGGYSDAISHVTGRDFPTWSVGLELSYALGNRSDGGEHERLRAEARQAAHLAEQVRRRVEEQVRARHRELVHGTARLEIASEGVDASLEQVRIGLIEYDSGRSTAFEVVRLAADVASSQRRLSDALVRTAKAASELRRLTAADLDELDDYGRTEE